MATEKNLKEAFAGESQANRMYLFPCYGGGKRHAG